MAHSRTFEEFVAVSFTGNKRIDFIRSYISKNTYLFLRGVVGKGPKWSNGLMVGSSLDVRAHHVCATHLPKVNCYTISILVQYFNKFFVVVKIYPLRRTLVPV